MSNVVEIEGFVDKQGQLEPFKLSISDAMASADDEDFFCVVSASSLLSSDRKIFGATDHQARELAVGFIRALLGETRVVDKDGREIAL